MFINLTPHIIRIAGLNIETKEDQVIEVPPSGRVAIRRPIMGEATARELDQFEFSVRSRALGPVEIMVQGDPKPQEFPKREKGTVYFVSSMVQGDPKPQEFPKREKGTVYFVSSMVQGDPKPQEFPQPSEGTIYIVSSMVQEGLTRPDVLAPDTGPTAIRKDGQVWAVVGLIGPE